MKVSISEVRRMVKEAVESLWEDLDTEVSAPTRISSSPRVRLARKNMEMRLVGEFIAELEEAGAVGIRRNRDKESLTFFAPTEETFHAVSRAARRSTSVVMFGEPEHWRGENFPHYIDFVPRQEADEEHIRAVDAAVESWIEKEIKPILQEFGARKVSLERIGPWTVRIVAIVPKRKKNHLVSALYSSMLS